MVWGINLKYPKNKLTISLLKQILLVFVLAGVIFTLFYKFAFPTYYYWKIEQPVKDAQIAIQNGEKIAASSDVITIKVNNYESENVEDLNEIMLNDLRKQGVALNKFWLDDYTLNKISQGKPVQTLYNQLQQKSDFYTIFFKKNSNLYIVGTNIVSFRDAVGTLVPLGIIAAIIIVLLIIILIVLITRRQLIRPIEQLEEATRSISLLDFSEKDIEIDNELGLLGHSINSMKSALKEHDRELIERNDQLQDFSSNLTHELKTPLSTMQLLVEAKKYGIENNNFLPDLEEQITTMNNLVQQILTYSQNQKNNIIFANSSIEELLSDQIKQYLVIAPKFTIETDISDMNLETNQEIFQLVIDNLITNAIKYSLDQHLTISGKQKRNHYELTFKNLAKKLPQEKFQQLKNPFIVAEDSRNSNLSGTGLGLTIADKAVSRLNGTLTLRQEKNNFVAYLKLPKSQKK